MNTCKTCKYWTGDCGAEDGVMVRFCTHKMVIQPTHGPKDQRIMIPSGVFTCDEGGATGDLMTGPDFGCIHWEEKK